jgi:predicted ATPase
MRACCAPGGWRCIPRLGPALERDADAVATRPALLGHHFAQAGAVEKAVPYFLRAGQRSAANSAMAEARAHLSRGLALAAEISDESDRKLRLAELTLARERADGGAWLRVARARSGVHRSSQALP